jgi:hypothetical protein
METKVTNNYFKYETNKYFRGNAHSIDLGCFGQKKDQVGAKSYLDVQNHVASKHLDSRVRYNTTAKIDWSQATKADVEAEGVLKFFGLGGKAAVSGSYEKAKSAKLELINFAIDEGPLKTMLNTDAGSARKFLADEGNDGRIVSEVWVVVDGELAEHFKTSGAFSVGASTSGNGLEVTAKGGTQGSQTILLEKDATFAYKMHKVKDWEKNKTVVGDLEADYYGMQ